MKSLFILLTLFTLTDPVLAEPADGTADYPEIYRTYPYGFENSPSQPEPTYHEEPRFFKLLQIIENDQQVITIKANLTVQELMQPIA
ncbi:MAG: hypothetical protein ACNYZG_00075 [Gammaproteobacteria bacterium]